MVAVSTALLVARRKRYEFAAGVAKLGEAEHRAFLTEEKKITATLLRRSGMGVPHLSHRFFFSKQRELFFLCQRAGCDTRMIFSSVQVHTISHSCAAEYTKSGLIQHLLVDELFFPLTNEAARPHCEALHSLMNPHLLRA